MKTFCVYNYVLNLRCKAPYFISYRTCALGHEWQLVCAKYFPNGKLLHIFRDLFLFIFRYVVVWFQLFCIRSNFFYYDKTWNPKKYPFADLQTFWNLIWKTFWHLEDIQIRSKINPYQMAKNSYMEVLFAISSFAI